MGQNVESAYLALHFFLYFLLTPVVDIAEYKFGISISVAAFIGTIVLLGIVNYPLLIANGKWRRILEKYPVPPPSKERAWLYLGAASVLALLFVLFPIGRMLK